MALNSLILLFGTLLNVICCCGAYKILLMFPIPSKSHAILGEGYVNHLTRAGHEITYIAPLLMKNPPAGVRQIAIPETKKLMPVEQIFDTRPLMNKELDLQSVNGIVPLVLNLANSTLHINNIQKLLDDPQEEFDAVIVEWLYTEMYSGLATVFNCPLIWSSSVEPHAMVLSLIDEYPNPSYTVHHLSRDYGLSFWHRVHQLWMLLDIQFLKWRFQSYEDEMFNSIYKKFVNKRGRQLPSYNEVRYNASLMLANSYISSGEAIRLPHSYRPIGGYHIRKELESLPEGLQKILDDAKHGVIYFCMGTILRSSRIPEHLIRDILKVFGALDQTVVWKFEETLTGLPSNVHVLPWVPQTSVLAHKNCVIFITHGGLLSELEALHFGVPIIAIPLYADQFINSNRAEHKGFGIRLDLYDDGARKLDSAIRQMLTNSSYRERIKEYSFIHHHRPAPPHKELVHWVEHVIKTRGALHLRSPALHMPWYQKYYVDLAILIIFIMAILVRLYKQARTILMRFIKVKVL